MKSSFEETLVEVWRQALVENARIVELGEKRYPVRRTSKRGLRQVDFVFDGNEIRGLVAGHGSATSVLAEPKSRSVAAGAVPGTAF